MIPDRAFQDGNLRLLPVSPDRDAPGLYELFLDERMHLYTGNRVPCDLQEIQDLLRQYIAHPGIWAWAVYDGVTFIGTYWLAIPEERGGKKVISADAQRIGVPFWRKGYARRCRDLLYRFAFCELGVDEIWGQAWEANRNSCIAMERYGFCLKRQSEDYNRKHNRMMTGNEYVLTRQRFFDLHQ